MNTNTRPADGGAGGTRTGTAPSAGEREGRARVRDFRDTFEKLTAGIGAVIVGHAAVVEQMLICLFAGGHALIEGVPGLGKTRMVGALSQCLGLSLARIQFTPDLMPADIVGSDVITDLGAGRDLAFQPGPIFGQLLLADEVNRATPKTQSALLEAMQEHAVTVGGKRHPLPAPFFVLATQNPIEIEGTYALPEAQIDRFMLKLSVDLPSAGELVEIIDRTTAATEPTPGRVTEIGHVEALQSLVREVLVAAEVKDHAARLVMATHPGAKGASSSVRRFVRYGASPRGAQALVLAAKVKALLGGRFNVSKRDLDEVALPALRHRIILNFEGDAQGISTDALVEEIVAG